MDGWRDRQAGETLLPVPGPLSPVALTAVGTSPPAVGKTQPPPLGIFTMTCGVGSSSPFTDEETEAPGVTHLPKVTTSASIRAGV